jgi:hypothetical protein
MATQTRTTLLETETVALTATHRELLARGHKVWRDAFGCFCVEAGNGATHISNEDWEAAEAAGLVETREIQARATAAVHQRYGKQVTRPLPFI